MKQRMLDVSAGHVKDNFRQPICGYVQKTWIAQVEQLGFTCLFRHTGSYEDGFLEMRLCSVCENLGEDLLRCWTINS